MYREFSGRKHRLFIPDTPRRRHMFGISVQEILIVFVVGLAIFGYKKLPEIGSGMGKAIKNFKKATSEPDEIDITPQASGKNKKKKNADDDA